jgi:predicted transcriptional regulator
VSRRAEIRLDDDTYRALDVIAKEESRSVPNLIRFIVQRWLTVRAGRPENDPLHVESFWRRSR